VGAHAGERIAEFALAMRHRLGLGKILATIHPYPTLMEGNKYVAGAWRRARQPAPAGAAGPLSPLAPRRDSDEATIMFKTRLRALLRPLMAAVPLLLTSPLHANDASWQQTLLAARGRTVYFNAWGQPEINAYLVWARQEIARQYQVELVQVKVDDIAQSVSQLLAGKQAGKTSNGPIDLLWVNGENFKALKEQGLLGAPFTDELPNMALVDTALPVSEDFTVPVEGWRPLGHRPAQSDGGWRPGQTLPTSAAALLAWTKAHPAASPTPSLPSFTALAFSSRSCWS
jgi:putative thiamine transport system substrate-binding protein